MAEAILRVVDMVIRTSPREMWGPVLQETGCFARLLSPFTSEVRFVLRLLGGVVLNIWLAVLVALCSGQVPRHLVLDGHERHGDILAAARGHSSAARSNSRAGRQRTCRRVD